MTVLQRLPVWLGDALPHEDKDGMTMNEEHSQAKNRAALVSLLAACLLTAIKLVVGIYTNSLGILSEALHSGLDLLAAAMTLYAVRLSSRPADARHPYGHGKVENLSALGETVLLFVICVWVVYEGAGRLLSGDTPVAPSIWGIIVMGISIVIDVNRVRVLKKVAKETRSQALEADALHFSTDILSSAVVLVGVGAVWLAAKLQLPEPVHKILVQADTVAALLVALIIFRASLHMAREAINMLMDSGSTEEQQAICEAVKHLPGVQDVQRVRLRSSGPHYFVDLTVGVDPAIRVSEGHKIAHDAELAVDAILPGADVTVHVEPVRSGQKEDPFTVVQRVASIQGLAVHDVQILRSGAGTLVEVHVEVPGQEAFCEAHKRGRAFEEALHSALPQAGIVTHIDPEERGDVQEEAAPAQTAVAELAWKEVEQAVGREPLLCCAHGYHAYTLPVYGLCISFHCCVRHELSVEEAHQLTVRLEKELRERLPLLGRILIHLEPPRTESAPLGK